MMATILCCLATRVGSLMKSEGWKVKVGLRSTNLYRCLEPKANEADLEDLTPEVRAELEVFPVETLGEVLEIAIPAARRLRKARAR